MPAPYTIEQTAEASGLSVKYVRRLRAAMPALFQRHTERGKNNALLFNEEMVEVLKRTKELRGRGRTLQQIREEMMGLAGEKRGEKEEQWEDVGAPHGGAQERSRVGAPHRGAQEQSRVGAPHGGAQAPPEAEETETAPQAQPVIPLVSALRRENALLQSQVSLLTGLLERAEARFDRLLPEARETKDKREKKENLKSQLLMWLVEGVVVTVFAAGFIFLIWLFAQKAFSL